MPGFKVSGLGEPADSRIIPYYKYTWEIDKLFDDVVDGPLIYLKEASTPSWTIEKEEVMGASLKYKFAKSIAFDDIKVSWYDTDGLAEIIRGWRRRVWTPEEGFKNPAEYKRLSVIRPMTYDLTGDVVWTLHNSWPQAVRCGDLTYSDSDVKLVEVTISYDWAEEETSPAIAGAKVAGQAPLPTIAGAGGTLNR